jgi:negative regulator of sigma E activity
MDHLISMYIDNELSLDEKILFLEHAHEMLRTELNKTAPDIEFKPSRASILPFFSRSLGWAAAACLLVVLSFMVRQDFNPQTLTQLSSEPATTMHRFVIHQQDSEQVEISGSFTNWQRIPLVPTGTNGYWEISLELPAGEHRYTFIVDGSKYFPDPTVATRESDDFGATNSILKIEA